jgi:predicted nucleic acid-binding protein
MEAIDPDDALYVAAALELDAAVWSMDEGLGEQTAVPHLTNSVMVARVRGSDTQ